MFAERAVVIAVKPCLDAMGVEIVTLIARQRSHFVLVSIIFQANRALLVVRELLVIEHQRQCLQG